MELLAANLSQIAAEALQIIPNSHVSGMIHHQHSPDTPASLFETNASLSNLFLRSNPSSKIIDASSESHQSPADEILDQIVGSSASFVHSSSSPSPMMMNNGPSSVISSLSGEEIRFPTYLRCTATTIYLILLFCGCPGNLLVPYVVLRTKELRNSTNIFLINLSVSDLLILLITSPTILIELHSQPEVWFLGLFMCEYF